MDTIDPLEPDELAWRTLYGTMEFLNWLGAELPNISHNALYSDLSPQEQVFAIFTEYASGEYLSSDRRFKKLNWTPDHCIWELKTDEIRIFGWVPQKNNFICCYGGDKSTIETLSLYGRYIAQTVRVRQNIDLDEPKHLTSRRYCDVISDAD